MSWPFTANRTTSSSVNVRSRGWSTTLTGTRTASSGDRTSSPWAAIALVVRPASHQHDVVAVLGQPPADHAADGPGTHHDEPHGPTLAGANLLRRAGTR